MKNHPAWPEIGRRTFCSGVVLGAASSLLLGCTNQPLESEEESQTPFVYRRMPPLMVDGWINDGPLTEEQMEGRVLVVDCFASWCGPCALAAPALVQTYLKYRYNGVRFLGLTSEGEDKLDQVLEFVRRHHTTWPIAYGAAATLIQLEVEAIPRVFVVGKDGMIHWDSQQSKGSMERAIRDALNEPNPHEEAEQASQAEEEEQITSDQSQVPSETQ